MLGAISLDTVLVCHPVLGGVDRVTFEAFVATKLIPKLHSGAKVVMDNANIHKGEMVRELIENADAKLVYLSRYSPEFSPIENMWSKVKNQLRKQAARTYKELIEGIVDAIAQVTVEHLRNWYTHCCYCTS
jgi:transposase